MKRAATLAAIPAALAIGLAVPASAADIGQAFDQAGRAEILTDVGDTCTPISTAVSAIEGIRLDNSTMAGSARGRVEADGVEPMESGRVQAQPLHFGTRHRPVEAHVDREPR